MMVKVFYVLHMKEENINPLQQKPTEVVPTLTSRTAHLPIGSDEIYTINQKNIHPRKAAVGRLC